MTIPIVPGPWSFLSGLGKTVGNYWEGQEKQRVTRRNEEIADRAEKLKQLGVVFDAVQNNQLSANTLKSPFFRELIVGSGLGEQFAASMVAPKPSEQVAAGQSEVLGQLIPSITAPTATPFQKEELAAGRIPTTQGAAQARVETGKAKVQAETIEAGGPAGRAAAGVLSPEVATAVEEKSRDVFYDTVAGRSVDAALRPQGGNILTADLQKLSDQAWAVAQDDARSQGYTVREEVTRPYIDAAITSRRREAEVEQMRATARQGTDQYPKYLDLLQKQQAMIRQQISALKEPDPLTYTQARAYEAQLAQKRTPEEQLAWQNAPGTVFLRSAYEQVRNYTAAVATLNNELNASRAEMNNALGPVVQGGVSTVPSQEKPSLDSASISAYANFLSSGTGTIQQLNQARESGGINDTDYAMIIAEAYGGTGTPQAQNAPPAATNRSPTGGGPR